MKTHILQFASQYVSLSSSPSLFGASIVLVINSAKLVDVCSFDALNVPAVTAFCQLRKYHIVNLRVVLCLTDRQPVTVYCRFCPMHAKAVCRHRPRGELNSTLQARDPSSEPHSVWISPQRALQSLSLHRHPWPQCIGLVCHREGIGDVSCMSIPPKEADHHVHWVLYPIIVSRSNHAVIGIENPQALPDCLSQPIVIHPLRFCWDRQKTSMEVPR